MKKNRKSLLPVWDLAVLYRGLNDPALARDRAMLDADIQLFRDKYRRRVQDLRGAALEVAIREYEVLDARHDKISTWLLLGNINGTAINDWDKKTRDRLNFFTSILVDTRASVPAYEPWLARLRTRTNPQDAKKLEKAQARYKKMSTALSTSPEARRAAAPRVAALYNRILQETDEIDAHDTNGLSTLALKRMSATIRKSYPRLSQRFEKWRAKKKKTLGMRYNESVRKYSWERACKIVLDGFSSFSPRFAEKARHLLVEKRVNATPHLDKDAWMMALGDMPFISLSFEGGIWSVFALAHEMGHGLHHMSMRRARTPLLAETTRCGDEIASLFAEMLAADALIKNARGEKMRNAVKEALLDSALHGVAGEVSYYDFERRTLKEAENGLVPAKRLTEIWTQVRRNYYGDVPFDTTNWMAVDEFFYTPFYSYSYPFAQIAALHLYDIYKSGKMPDFVGKFERMLEAGLTQDPHEMLAPFGLDPEDRAFWRNGVAILEKRLDNLINAPAIKPKSPRP